MSPSYATSKSPSDFWMGQNTKKSIKFIRVTFNKTRKHHMWNWVLNKSNPSFYAAFGWLPLSQHPRVQHLPPKKGWLYSPHLYLLFPSFEVVYQGMLVSSLPYLFCAGGSPRVTHLQKKKRCPGDQPPRQDSSHSSSVHSLRGAEWARSSVGWKNGETFRKPPFFVEENQQKLLGLESKLLMVCRWYSSSKTNVAGIILGFVGSMLLRIKNLVAASFITPYSDRTMRERNHGIWAKFGHQPAKTWKGAPSTTKKCREIPGMIGPHLEGGIVTSLLF